MSCLAAASHGFSGTVCQRITINSRLGECLIASESFYLSLLALKKVAGSVLMTQHADFRSVHYSNIEAEHD